jgi:hypothetical protein
VEHIALSGGTGITSWSIRFLIISFVVGTVMCGIVPDIQAANDTPPVKYGAPRRSLAVHPVFLLVRVETRE